MAPTTADIYRLKAADLKTMAEEDTNPSLKREHERLAQGYLRLLKHAEQNDPAKPTRSPTRNNKAKRQS